MALLALLWLRGYLPNTAASMALASSVYTLWSLAIGVRLSVFLGVAWCLPLGAHWVLTAHYADAQAAWTAHLYGTHDAPLLPRAAPHEVVALLAGIVWALPVWHLLCVTTEHLALPTPFNH